MLTRLIIQNYAIISSLDLSFGRGLSVITGETGAGKSILLGALGLALGRRADLKALPDEQSKCIVEAHFDLPDDALISLFLREELDFDRRLICRREIGAGGRSRSFINDTPVSLKTLQEVTARIIELHHQHDNLALQSKDYQVQMLDTITGSLKLLADYSACYSQWQSAKQELARLEELESSSARRKDFLDFQLRELHEARLMPGEIASLEESQLMLENTEAIDQALSAIQAVLNEGAHSVNAQLTSLVRQTGAVLKVFPPVGGIAERLDALRIEVQDLAMEAGRLESPGVKDPAMLTKVQGRLTQLYHLIKKYQCADEDQLIGLLHSFENEIAALSSVSEEIGTLEKNIAQLSDTLHTLGGRLTEARKKGAKKLLPRVTALLAELGMPNARFDIAFDAAGSPGVSGMDDISYLFSANKGMSLQPLQAVASGGELSRLSLVMKSIYAQQAELPVIIFDEIDTGISGEVAWRMGQLIVQMSKGQQIIMITHSPQIAAQAGTQYHVSKSAKGDRDTSQVDVLDAGRRISEIAKMLSGDTPSAAALANAESLLAEAKHS